MKFTLKRHDQRGAALMEFAIAASAFFIAIFGVIEFGRLLWTHNQLKDAARRGARYAAVRKQGDEGAVAKYVVYGDPNADTTSAKPVVPGLTTANVDIVYKNFDGIRLSARAIVLITNYQFQFSVPLVGTTVTLPNYWTSSPGESAGFVPCNISSGTPAAACPIIPN